MNRWEHLLGASTRCARLIVEHEAVPRTPQSYWMRRECETLAAYGAPEVEPLSGNAGRNGAHQLMALLLATWPEICAGASTVDITRRIPGIWRRFNRDYPMGEHGRALAQHVFSEMKGATVLEVGAGVGNTTTHLLPQTTPELYVASDLHPEISTREGLGEFATVTRFDLDECLFTDPVRPVPVERFDWIIGTNALHCAAKPRATLPVLLDRLNDKGSFAFAEGVPLVGSGVPWPLNWCCGIFDGWWNRGGFRNSTEWAGMFRDLGRAVLIEPIVDEATDTHLGYLYSGGQG